MKRTDRSKHCEQHQPTVAVCDMCGTTAPAVKAGRYPNQYDDTPDGWHEVKGLRPGEGFKGMDCCPGCYGTVRVGLDWSLDRGGEPLLSESIACAFAFHLGQAIALNAPLHEMMKPEFVIAERMSMAMPRWGSPMWGDVALPCRHQGPSGAQCNQPTGHGGAHQAPGGYVWVSF